jgi:hypothetical protein
MRIPADVALEISRAIAQLGETAWPDLAGREHNALPLFADLGGAVLLRADGTFLELEWDEPTERTPRLLEQPSYAPALAIGAERFPCLRPLLPPRPANAITCDTCHGRGRLPVVSIPCAACAALGWRAA